MQSIKLLTFTNRRCFFLLNDFKVTFQIIAENQKLEIREKVMMLREIHEKKNKTELVTFPKPSVNNMQPLGEY